MNWFIPSKINENKIFKTPQNYDDFSIFEIKNSIIFLGIENISFPDMLRTELNNFKNHFPDLPCIDVGNFSGSLENLLEATIKLCEGNNILFLIGGNAQFIMNLKSYLEAPVISWIDNTIPDSSIWPTLNLVAFQRQNASLRELADLNDVALNHISLGRMRTQMETLEPVLRDSTVLYIHIDSLKSCEVPNALLANPSGLTTEELCQIAHHCGGANQLQLVNFDFHPYTHLDSREAAVMAEAVWYALEGLKYKNSEHPNKKENFNEFIIQLPDYDVDVHFFKSELTGRWWFLNKDNHYMSCSMAEYQACLSNEITDRLLKNIV